MYRNKIYLTGFLVLFVSFEMFSQDSISAETKKDVIYNGIGIGGVVAGITSWERNKSAPYLFRK